ncbi:MAG: TetR/AcrR family transcriptional regulator [Chloroflexota bacterium]
MPDTKIPTKGEKTRATILEAAHTLFLKNGFHGTSMRQIAEEAGLALGGLYNYFDSKEKIFGEVLDAHHPYHVVLPALEHTQGETIEEFVHDAAGKMRVGIDGVEDQLMPLVMIDLVEFQGRYLKRLATKLIPKLLPFVEKFGKRKGKLRAIPTPIMLRTFMLMLVGFLLTEMIIKGTPLKLMRYDWFDGMIEIYLHGIVQE